MCLTAPLYCHGQLVFYQQPSRRSSEHPNPGAASGSNSPTAESTVIQRVETALNNCESDVGSPTDKSRNMAALPVTQQMTEMSISREDNASSPKTESSEPVVTQPSPSVSQPSTSQNEEKTPELPKPKKNRCFMCRKKIGLTGILPLITFMEFPGHTYPCEDLGPWAIMSCSWLCKLHSVASYYSTALDISMLFGRSH
ncbi:hypothetical protein GDO81_001618 [Engystomops pustulosus]|uniref:Uncharacterized protein n=1 Tax=Engystomops pustulosus TaxID=76066 RepID=A0AAV7DHV8_ENGPU|nr:hypothetical protein GDO81_001618 [Engystomops pustulosus]